MTCSARRVVNLTASAASESGEVKVRLLERKILSTAPADRGE
eukprot:CAMPEP_0204324894 /NCGR_PEP_ID=MMETSP0469-20131031/10607_1 /ASSEMBLY_ACC=CAM_ASM_000384 /TAXON_ID=2969 /ORGANISM="Oxyrrhis marina" /LENGTH=41 /DNA_ID= /DNA_START= /DNA_END= /DNA_ORIENTATION=